MPHSNMGRRRAASLRRGYLVLRHATMLSARPTVTRDTTSRASRRDAMLAADTARYASIRRCVRDTRHYCQHSHVFTPPRPRARCATRLSVAAEAVTFRRHLYMTDVVTRRKVKGLPAPPRVIYLPLDERRRHLRWLRLLPPCDTNMRR